MVRYIPLRPYMCRSMLYTFILFGFCTCVWLYLHSSVSSKEIVSRAEVRVSNVLGCFLEIALRKVRQWPPPLHALLLPRALQRRPPPRHTPTPAALPRADGVSPQPEVARTPLHATSNAGLVHIRMSMSPLSCAQLGSELISKHARRHFT